MIVIKDPYVYTFEEGTRFPICLPDSALSGSIGEVAPIPGVYLGYAFTRSSFQFSPDVIEIIPEIKINRVCGIPSLEGVVFDEDTD